MTEVNGLHLAFRGLIAGLAAGWVWVAVALTGLILAGTDPLAATTHLGNGTAGTGLISALAIAQVGAGWSSRTSSVATSRCVARSRLRHWRSPSWAGWPPPTSSTGAG